ncbi:MAG: glycine cleavage system protein GcvH [Synergistaceae bacterium]|nr:glycine cleavage system protein GcvH [Synergistota bacterium]NLM70981.1 glycine cleavage system protein GcvH [Synergistaceae bacterium]
MSKIPEDLRYTKDHEWIKIEGNIGTVGVTDYAQNAMGDVVYVELPEVGDEVAAGDDFIVIESVKGANDVFSPVSGKVAEVNEELDGAPELVNQDAYANWLAKLEVADPSEADKLLDAAAYAKLLEELEAEGS